MKLTKEAVAELTFNDTQLIQDNEYEYRVMAENKAGVGPPSNTSQPFTARDPWRKLCLLSSGNHASLRTAMVVHVYGT